MKRANTLRQLQKEFETVVSVVAGDTRFSAQGVLFIAERAAGIEKALAGIEKALTRNGRTKREPSEWSRFFAAGMKAGKSAKLIGAEWRERKGKKGGKP